MLVVSTVSRNLLIYIFLVSQSIPVSITGCLKRSSGLQDTLAHTVIRQDGGMGRSVPNRSASLFLSYNNNNDYNANVIIYQKIVFQWEIHKINTYTSLLSVVPYEVQYSILYKLLVPY